MTSRSKASLLSALALLSGSLASETAQAHGYIDSPPARGYACKLGQNIDCGAIYWEPQSLEGPDSWPQRGPADGSIAAAGSSNWSPLNEQSATRWAKQPMQAGLQRFTWTFTAPHVSEGWRYYITRDNWNAATPLARHSFELTPFCSHSGYMRRPPARLTHECNVPERRGYHVILGVWNVGDTGAAFYNVIDVEFTQEAVTGSQGDNPAPKWKEIGAINPSTTLRPGDSVTVRLFNARGELSGAMPTLLITQAAQGAINVWPRLMAEQINRGDFGLRAGGLDTSDAPRARLGVNPLWVQADSALVRAEIQLIRAPDADAQESLQVLSAPHTVTMRQGNGVIDVVVGGPIGSRGSLVVRHDVAGEIARTEIRQTDEVQTQTLQLVGLEPGSYQLALFNTQPPSGAADHNHAFRVTADAGDRTRAGACHAAAGTAVDAAQWGPEAAYQAGDVVKHQGTQYRARWWTRGEVPASSAVWEPVASTAPTTTKQWSADKTYLAGDTAEYRGKQWRTKWWNRGSPPSMATGWIQLGNGACP
jgi:chitin-binding protein